MDTRLIGAWFGSAFLCLIFSLTFLSFLTTDKILSSSPTSYYLYQALPENQVVSQDDITHKDARAKIVENFFKSNGSVLAQYGDLFIQTADKHNLDYRLLPAIAMQESNGGRVIPNNSFNPFGYGIYGNKVLRFSSWEEGIEIVAKGLRENYLNQGLTTPYQIMTKYTPPSAKGNGSWAKGVTVFMSELR